MLSRFLIAVGWLTLRADAHMHNATTAHEHGSGGARDVVDYEVVLSALWTQTDVNADGSLNKDEYMSALTKLGVTVGRTPAECQQTAPCTLREHASAGDLFTALDTSANGQLTKQELAEAVNDYPNYRQPLISAFTNGAGEVPTDPMAFLPTREILAATEILEFVVRVAGPPNAIYPGQREMIRKQFADTAGVQVTSVILKFTCVGGGTSEAACFVNNRRMQGPVVAGSAGSSGRRVQATTGPSTSIDGTIFIPANVDAAAAYANLAAPATPLAESAAFRGLEITAPPYYPLPLTLKGVLPGGDIAIAGVLILLVLPIAIICVACAWAKKNRSNLPVEPAGCCTNGCCSFNAVGPWACGELCGFGLVLAATVVFMIETDLVVAAAASLAHTGFQILDSELPFVTGMVAGLDLTLVTEVRANMRLIRAVPLAIALPGIVASALLLLASLCAVAPMHKGSYCLTKLMIVLAWLVMLATLVVFIVVASFAFLLALGPPEVDAAITTLRTTCITVPSAASQLITDNKAALYQIEAAGQDVSEMQAQLEEIEAVAGLVSYGCDSVEAFYQAVFRTCFPALLGTIAICYSFFSNQMLCCAAGCCKGPPAEAPAGKAPPPTMTGVQEMTEVQVKSDE